MCRKRRRPRRQVRNYQQFNAHDSTPRDHQSNKRGIDQQPDTKRVFYENHFNARPSTIKNNATMMAQARTISPK
jgi:hypothetical protein